MKDKAFRYQLPSKAHEFNSYKTACAGHVVWWFEPLHTHLQRALSRVRPAAGCECLYVIPPIQIQQEWIGTSGAVPRNTLPWRAKIYLITCSLRTLPWQLLGSMNLKSRDNTFPTGKSLIRDAPWFGGVAPPSLVNVVNILGKMTLKRWCLQT